MEKNLRSKIWRGRNQNGVVVFSNLKDATKIVLVNLDINNIGYLLHTLVFFNSSTYLNG